MNQASQASSLFASWLQAHVLQLMEEQHQAAPMAHSAEHATQGHVSPQPGWWGLGGRVRRHVQTVTVLASRHALWGATSSQAPMPLCW